MPIQFWKTRSSKEGKYEYRYKYKYNLKRQEGQKKTNTEANTI